MNAQQTANLYLAELGKELGQEGLVFDAEGAVTLILDAGVSLELRVMGEGRAIRLESMLRGSGHALPDSFLRRCLAGNFLWLGTRGATLLAKPGGALRLYLRQQLDLTAADYAGFRAAIETFLNTALSWQRECLAAGEPAAAQEERSPPTVGEPAMIIYG